MVSLHRLVWILCFVYCYLPTRGSQDFYFSDLCTHGYKEVTVHTSDTGDNVTGILRANRDSPSKSGLNCTLILEPPEDYGLVLGIEELDLQKSGVCEGNLTISQKTNNSDWEEVYKQCARDMQQRPFLNVSGWFKINYFEKPENSLSLEIIYTTYHNAPCEDSEFKCSNWICIPKELKCDGVNHCGDNSDEWPRISCPYYSAMIGGLFVGGVLIVLAAGYYIHRRRTKRAEVPYEVFESGTRRTTSQKKDLARSDSNSDSQKQDSTAASSNHA